MDQQIIPNHIAIIPDGNRRWAREHNLPAFEGHKKGLEVGTAIAKKIRAAGVSTLTIWAFSTENWSRDNEEVKNLLQMYEIYIEQHLEEALSDNVRLVYLGRKDRMPKSLIEKIQKVEEKTKHFDQYVLNIALDYGGRDEILRAVKKAGAIGQDIQALTEDSFAQFLDTVGQPHPFPDLIIRTSGELRTSGLLPWQAAYAEYFFLDKYFPDLNEADIDMIIADFGRRQRRFGA